MLEGISLTLNVYYQIKMKVNKMKKKKHVSLLTTHIKAVWEVTLAQEILIQKWISFSAQVSLISG